MKNSRLKKLAQYWEGPKIRLERGFVKSVPALGRLISPGLLGPYSVESAYLISGPSGFVQ